MSDFEFTKRILFVGIPDMAIVCLDGLASAGVNIVGVIGPKKEHPTYSMFESFVASRGLEFIKWDNLKSPELISKIKSLDVDLAVVSSFNNKIPNVMLDSVKDGFVNIHPSLLPQYRGSNPYSNVLVNMEKETGVTLHFMDESFDTGDLIAQKRLPIAPDETMGTLFNKLNFMGMQMLVDVLKFYETSEIPRVKQPEGDFIVGNNFGDDDLFIDYSKSAKEIDAFIRAMNPFLVASTNFRQTFMKIFSAKYSEEKVNVPCGTVVDVSESSFGIATGCGIIYPTAVQFGGFFIGCAEDFVRIVAPKNGEEFK